jgi:hypothetical protein
MDTAQFDRIVRQLVSSGTRRGLLRLLALLPPTGALSTHFAANAGEARKKHKKKRHKHKHKRKCGRAGGKPVKGRCCAGSVRVAGVCQPCNVCASGCAFSTVQDAINAASSGATIAICAGIYEEDLLIDIADQNLTLVGAGDGDGANDTIVRSTGDLTGVSVVAVLSGTASLQNLRITGGANDASGAGVFNAGTLAVIGCTVIANTTAFEGGGIYNAGSLSLTNSIITANTAGKGGGFYNIAGTVTLDADSRVTGNTASDDGGGIFNDNGTVSLVSSANVSGNTPNNCAGTNVPMCSG